MARWDVAAWVALVTDLLFVLVAGAIGVAWYTTNRPTAARYTFNISQIEAETTLLR